MIAGVRREGFAMLQDQAKRLIAFHADSPRLWVGVDEPQRASEDFTIPEDDFEAILVPGDKK